MAKRVMTTAQGDHYITFGDKERKYQLFESPDVTHGRRHNFEIRLNGSPTDVFARYSMVMKINTPLQTQFTHAVKMGKSEMDLHIASFAKDVPDATGVLAVMQHLRRCLDDVEIQGAKNNTIEEQEG